MMNNNHNHSCSCQSCVQTKTEHQTLYPHWRERRSHRLGRVIHKPSCNCSICKDRTFFQTQKQQELEEEHLYWRNRRKARIGFELEEGEFPMLHFANTDLNVLQSNGEMTVLTKRLIVPYEEDYEAPRVSGQIQVSYITLGPAARRNMIQMWSNKLARVSDPKKKHRIQQIIANIRQCKRPYYWGQSEWDVQNLYRAQKYRNAKGQATILNNKLLKKVKGYPKYSHRPDILLPYYAQSIEGMKLKSDTGLEMEIVEVKRYKAHSPFLVDNVVNQIIKRQNIRIKGRPTGKYQTVVLDFRGQKANSAEIKRKVDAIATKVRTNAPNVNLLIQILFWGQCNEPL